jgi:hypothetical protein
MEARMRIGRKAIAMTGLRAAPYAGLAAVVFYAAEWATWRKWGRAEKVFD